MKNNLVSKLGFRDMSSGINPVNINAIMPKNPDSYQSSCVSNKKLALPKNPDSYQSSCISSTGLSNLMTSTRYDFGGILNDDNSDLSDDAKEMFQGWHDEKLERSMNVIDVMNEKMTSDEFDDKWNSED